MNPALLGAVFSASLLGSLHCAGMCGPFVALYAGDAVRTTRQKALGHAGYHLGRLLTYASLGGIAGAVGSAINIVFDATGWVQLAALLSSLFLILWGVVSLVPALRVRFQRRVGGMTKSAQLLRLGTRPRVLRGPLLGVFTPLLPCGWLYAFVLLAAGTGSVFDGLSVMAVFWAGTVPALLGLGWLVQSLSQRLRARLPVITAVTLIGIGVVGVVFRAERPIELRTAQSVAPSTTAVQSGAAHCH